MVEVTKLGNRGKGLQIGGGLFYDQFTCWALLPPSTRHEQLTGGRNRREL